MAQGDSDPDVSVVLLPDNLEGYLGDGMYAIIAWFLGAGVSYLQVLINNIAAKAGKTVSAGLNTALSFGFVVAVTAALVIFNLIATPEGLVNYEPTYDLIRGFLLLIFAYSGNQAKYYNANRAIQVERKAAAIG